MIIFLHGSDTYRSRKKLQELQQKFFNEVDQQGYNLTVLSGAEASVAKIIESISTMPFMASKRMVIVEELSKMNTTDKEEESLVEIMESLLEQDTIFVVWEAELGKRPFKTPVFQVIQKSKYIMPFESWNPQQVAGWMAEEFRKEGIAIAPDALHHLSLSVNDDLWRASSEAEKLINYAKANKLNSLEKKEVSLLVVGGVYDNIFELVDTVSQGNLQGALKRLHDQLQAGSHELEIVGMLFRQFRLLRQIKDGLSSGQSPDAIASHYGIHPFVVKKMSGQANQISDEAIQESYQALISLDASIKSSGLSPTLLLSKTVAGIVV